MRTRTQQPQRLPRPPGRRAHPRRHMTNHALVIPPTGILQVLHGDSDINPEATLRSIYPTDAGFILLRFTASDGTGGAVGFFPSLPAANLRAREAMRILTSTHMVFAGPAIFTGVSEVRLGEVVATLSV